MRKRLLIALLLCFVLTATAGAVTVDCDGALLAPDAAYLQDGTTWVSLRAVGEAYGLPVSWDGRQARIGAVTAQPGQAYISAGGRYFFAQTVQVREGVSYVPVRTLAAALGAEVSWNGANQMVTLGAARGIEKAESVYDTQELYWLSRIIHAESGAEPLLGKIAVGNVVLARVASQEFPGSIYDVIFDRKNGVQFTPTANGMVYGEPSEESVIAAKLCLEGAVVAKECLYFFNPDKATSMWIRDNRTYAMTIGEHDFYY